MNYEQHLRDFVDRLYAARTSELEEFMKTVRDAISPDDDDELHREVAILGLEFMLARWADLVTRDFVPDEPIEIISDGGKLWREISEGWEEIDDVDAPIAFTLSASAKGAPTLG